MTTESTPLPTLYEILSRYPISELKEFAKVLHIRGFSKMRKTDLADVVSHALLDEWLIESILITQSDRIFAIFLRSVQSGEAVKMEPDDSDFHTKIFFQLFLPPCDNGKRYIPIEVRDKCMSLINGGLSEKRKRCWALHRYALAAVNLYGMISTYELIDIFNRQNARKVGADELIDVLGMFTTSHMGYCLWQDYVVEEEFAYNGFSDLADLNRLIDGKPRYVPGKKEFLRYADWAYYEQSPYTIKLFRFLQKEFHVSVEDASNMVREMQHACVINCDLGFYSKFLADFDIILTQKQASHFFEIISEVYSNARLWSNKGYTPNELAALKK